MLPGFYLQHKPVGVTSFELVRRLQLQISTGGRRWPSCHGGVLDPFAEGLMILLVGPATRLMDLLHPLPKTYEATVRWGRETDTGDHLGKEVATGDPTSLTPAALEGALAPFLGWTEQVPPPTSNKRVDGERAYRRAHRGEVLVLPPSRVYLHAARWTEHHLPGMSRLELVCRGGFYVRSLVRDLGRALGARAHLEMLRRTRIGPWDDVAGDGLTHLAGEAILPWCPRRVLSDAEVGLLRQCGSVARGDLLRPRWSPPRGYPPPDSPVLGIHQGRLASLLEERDGALFLNVALRGGL